MTFSGPIYHTGEWPHEGVDFTGKKVAVIGTGSSAIQSIPLIAAQARELTVFQRTATYSVPAWNEPLIQRRQRGQSQLPRPDAQRPAPGRRVLLPLQHEAAHGASPEERRANMRKPGNGRPAIPWRIRDLLFDKEANDTVAEFAREKIRGS